MESLRPLHKANFSDVLDYGIYLYKKHFKRIFLLNLMLNIPFMVLIAVVNPVFAAKYQDFLNPLTALQTNPAVMFSSSFSLYAMFFIYFAIYGIHSYTLKNIFNGAIVKIIYSSAVLDVNRSLKQVIKECFGQFGTLLLGKAFYMLIQGAVFFVAYLILLFGIFSSVFAAMGVFLSATVSPWITVLLTIIGILVAGSVVFFIALIIGSFLGRYWMFLPAICIEQKNAGSSIERCNEVVKNNFYMTGFVYLSIFILVLIPPNLISAVITFINISSGTMNMAVLKLGSIITQIIYLLLQPLSTCVLTALYITLRIKREGLDMESDLWEIKKEEADKTRKWSSEARNEQ